jgi:hypothetical protein
MVVVLCSIKDSKSLYPKEEGKPAVLTYWCILSIKAALITTDCTEAAR